MATLVSWDVDNLKVLYRPTVTKVDACCCLSAEYSTADCCCFLDPDTDAWSSGTTYADGDLCEYNTKTWESLQNNNLNHTPTENTWWHKVSDAVSCGNTDWNTYQPYGGAGKTPEYLTITFSGITNYLTGDCTSSGISPNPSPNRTFVVARSNTPYNCYWQCGNYPGGGTWVGDTECQDPSEWAPDHWFVQVALYPDGTTGWVFLWHSPFEDCGHPCEIFKAYVNPGCSIVGNTINNGLSYYGGTATVSVGANLSTWQISHPYVVGNTVFLTSTAYICKANHTSTINNMPGSGIDWTTYWAILTDCV